MNPDDQRSTMQPDPAPEDEAVMLRRNDRTARPCPECSREGVEGARNIGNRRHECRTCNSFAQRVRRAVDKELRAVMADDLLEITDTIEARLYRDLVGAELNLTGGGK